MLRSRCFRWHPIFTLALRSSRNTPRLSMLDPDSRGQSRWLMINIHEYGWMTLKINMAPGEDTVQEDTRDNQVMRKTNEEAVGILPPSKMMTSKQHMAGAKAGHVAAEDQKRDHMETNPWRSIFRSKQKSSRTWTQGQWASKRTALSKSVEEWDKLPERRKYLAIRSELALYASIKLIKPIRMRLSRPLTRRDWSPEPMPSICLVDQSRLRSYSIHSS